MTLYPSLKPYLEWQYWRPGLQVSQPSSFLPIVYWLHFCLLFSSRFSHINNSDSKARLGLNGYVRCHRCQYLCNCGWIRPSMASKMSDPISEQQRRLQTGFYSDRKRCTALYFNSFIDNHICISSRTETMLLEIVHKILPYLCTHSPYLSGRQYFTRTVCSLLIMSPRFPQKQ